jgi:hypothetical protein
MAVDISTSQFLFKDSKPIRLKNLFNKPTSGLNTADLNIIPITIGFITTGENTTVLWTFFIFILLHNASAIKNPKMVLKITVTNVKYSVFRMDGRNMGYTSNCLKLSSPTKLTLSTLYEDQSVKLRNSDKILGTMKKIVKSIPAGNMNKIELSNDDFLIILIHPSVSGL